jgi:hypothetical protein
MCCSPALENAGRARALDDCVFAGGKLLASCTGEYRKPEDPAELTLWDLR